MTIYCNHTLHDTKRRYDPTGTTDLRNRFRSDSDRRWSKMRQLTVRVLTEEDLLGMTGLRPSSLADDPVQKFQAWVEGAMSRIVLGGNGGWTSAYLDEAEARGRSRASALMGHEGVGQSLAHGTVASVATSELRGILGAVSQQAARLVAAGLLAHQRPRRLASDVANRILSIGRTRTRTLVNYAVVKAYNSATLETYRALGVQHVGTIPETKPRPPLTGDATKAKKETEKLLKAAKATTTGGGKWKSKKKKALPDLVEVLTAGDDDVCPICEDISQEGPYLIDDAQSLIPAHPNCRCVFIPADDERFAEVRE